MIACTTIILTTISLVAMILPLIPGEYWLFRAFSFPKIQILILQLLTIVLLSFRVWPANTVLATTIILALLYNCILLLQSIIPYTRLGKKQVKTSKNPGIQKDQISILIWNVYQHNRNVADFQQQITKLQPNVILLCETDQWWVDALQFLKKEYTENIEIPLPNTYGMCMYANYPLSDIKIEYLLHHEVPSIHATILVNGRFVRLHGLHPIPPVPKYSWTTAPRDAELLLVAKKVKNSDLPQLVFGDLNDVAWSKLTRLFQKTSRLLDTRCGRGILPTFHAKIPFMQVPIDQLYCSAEFQIITIKRLPACGSDHFPLFTSLVLANNTAKVILPPTDDKDRQEVQERINRGIEIASSGEIPVTE